MLPGRRAGGQRGEGGVGLTFLQFSGMADGQNNTVFSEWTSSSNIHASAEQCTGCAYEKQAGAGAAPRCGTRGIAGQRHIPAVPAAPGALGCAAASEPRSRD